MDKQAIDIAAKLSPAELERQKIVAWLRGDGGVIPGLAAFAPLVSGNSQPCMSGDPRDRLYPHTRRQFDDAIRAVADAIERGAHLEEQSHG
jgi:hypothetical protein